MASRSGKYGLAYEHADCGELAEAIQLLEAYLQENRNADRAQADALMLHGKCKQGILDNPHAVMAFESAAEIYQSVQALDMVSYCQLLILRTKADDRQYAVVVDKIDLIVKAAEQHNWTGVLSQAYWILARVARQQRRVNDAVSWGTKSVESEDRDRLAWELAANKAVLDSQQQINDYSENGEITAGFLEQLEAFKSIPRIRIYILSELSRVALLNHDLPTAQVHLQSLMEFLEECPDQWVGKFWMKAACLYNLGNNCNALGEYETAQQRFTEAVKIADARQYRHLSLVLRNSLGHLALLQGRIEDAVERYRFFQENAARYDTFFYHTSFYYLAIALLAAGEIEDSRAQWLRKPALDTNRETRLILEDLKSLLERITSPEYNPSVQQPESIENLAQEWIVELNHLIGHAD